MVKKRRKNKGKGVFSWLKGGGNDKASPDNSRDVSVTPIQQVKSPTLDKIYSLSKGSQREEPFNAIYLYQISDEIKWFIKPKFMRSMDLKDTYGLEKDCRQQTKEIEDDIVRAKLSKSPDVQASDKWIRQQINNAIYINVNISRIVDTEKAHYTKGTWLYKSKTSDRGDLSQMRMVTNGEMYGILQRYFNDFIAFF